MDMTTEDERAPRFVTLPEVTHAYRGVRPGGLEGAIVHYDAGRARGAPGDRDRGARTTLASGQADGFAFVTIGQAGTIFLPRDMRWEAWGHHAGASRCPATGRTGVSRHYVGIEVNGPGRVLPTRDPDVFVPWFDAVRDARGAVTLDRAGRATVRAGGGELYRRAELRHVPVALGNVQPGFYAPFTGEQMAALRALLRWLRARFPATFRLDRVFGHDEVAPARKSDPGGALGDAAADGPGAALPMAAFRAALMAERR